MRTQTLWNKAHKHLLWEWKAVKNENTTVFCDLRYLTYHMWSCLWFCINLISHDRFIICDCWIQTWIWIWDTMIIRCFWFGIIYSLYCSFIPHNHSLSKQRYLCISAAQTMLVSNCLYLLLGLQSKSGQPITLNNSYNRSLHSSFRQTYKNNWKDLIRTLLIEHAGTVVNYCFSVSRRNCSFHGFQKLTGL